MKKKIFAFILIFSFIIFILIYFYNNNYNKNILHDHTDNLKFEYDIPNTKLIKTNYYDILKEYEIENNYEKILNRINEDESIIKNLHIIDLETKVVNTFYKIYESELKSIKTLSNIQNEKVMKPYSSEIEFFKKHLIILETEIGNISIYLSDFYIDDAIKDKHYHIISINNDNYIVSEKMYESFKNIIYSYLVGMTICN